jgi:hypothetical protein
MTHLKLLEKQELIPKVVDQKKYRAEINRIETKRTTVTSKGWVRWFMPVTLATQEVDMGWIKVQGQPEKKIHKIPHLK